jgi:lysophospholipase L1-like esterase
MGAPAPLCPNQQRAGASPRAPTLVPSERLEPGEPRRPHLQWQAGSVGCEQRRDSGASLSMDRSVTDRMVFQARIAVPLPAGSSCAKRHRGQHEGQSWAEGLRAAGPGMAERWASSPAGTCPVTRLGRVLVLAVAMMGLCVAPSLARADAASDYGAAVLAGPALASPSPTPGVQFTASYDASTGSTPDLACPSWAWFSAGGPSQPSVSGGALRITNTTTKQPSGYQQPAPGQALTIPNPLVIEARMRLVSGTSTDATRGPASIGFTTSPNFGNGLQISNGQVFLNQSETQKGPSASVDTAGFHTYRIEVTGGGAISVFQDGTFVLSGAEYTSAADAGGQVRIEWGNGSNLAYGTSDWQFVHHNAASCTSPEVPPPPPPPPPVSGSRYVAMGDSYSAGEGTANYDAGTDTGSDKCHRSTADSYPRLLQQMSSAVPSTLTFVACSGATIYNVLHGQNGESPQMYALCAVSNSLTTCDGSDVKLVTISVGGDDLGFHYVLEECVSVYGFFHLRSDETCEGQENEIHEKMYTDRPTLGTRLIGLYREIKHFAPNARIVVMGYPHAFPLYGDHSCGLPGLTYLGSRKIKWLNKMALELDRYLAAAVNASGVAEYVSTFNAMTDNSGNDHSACGDNKPWINELQLYHLPLLYTNESFHPNPEGYEAFARALLPTISGVPNATGFTISQGQIVGPTTTVPPAASWLTVGVSWPGSTVSTSLVSPRGRVISAQTASKVRGVQHEVGPTYEVYSIANPEPGHWQIRALGVSVAAGGEPVRISVHTERRRHRPPIARATARPTHGRAPLRVVFAANGSRAAEGRIRQYLWSFGDGTHGKGRRVKHTYRHPGRYTALLKVIDTSGASTLASTKTITIRR